MAINIFIFGIFYPARYKNGAINYRPVGYVLFNFKCVEKVLIVFKLNVV